VYQYWDVCEFTISTQLPKIKIQILNKKFPHVSSVFFWGAKLNKLCLKFGQLIKFLVKTGFGILDSENSENPKKNFGKHNGLFFSSFELDKWWRDMKNILWGDNSSKKTFWSFFEFWFWLENFLKEREIFFQVFVWETFSKSRWFQPLAKNSTLFFEHENFAQIRTRI